MQTDGFLVAIAQIAVALAGFSGLVVATRGSPGSGWYPRDIWSLSWMFGSSLGALFLALLPILLSLFRLSEITTWTAAKLVMGVFMMGFALVMISADKRLTKSGHPARVGYFPLGATLLVLISGCLAGLAGAGPLREWRIGFFALGLVVCLLVSALALVVFLVILARRCIREGKEG